MTPPQTLEQILEEMQGENERLKVKYHDASVEIDRKRGIILKLREGLEKARAQLEMFNFAKDEIRVRYADDILLHALAADAEMEGNK